MTLNITFYEQIVINIAVGVESNTGNYSLEISKAF